MVERVPFRKRCADASAASNAERRAVFGRALSILGVFDLEQEINGSRVRTHRPALRFRSVASMANNGAKQRECCCVTAPLYRLSKRLAPPLPPSRAQEWWKGVRRALAS